MNENLKLEDFDDIWGQLGDPLLVAAKFCELLSQAQALQNKSIYLQILSQLALAQSLLKNFDQAHKTLDDAQAQLKPEYNLAQVRILCERGRVLQQAGNIEQARNYFQQSFELSLECGFDTQTINAAHMIAIVADDNTKDKIRWNQIGLDLVMNTQDPKARAWAGSLYNNLGMNYFDDQQFDKALEMFELALQDRKNEDQVFNLSFGQYQVARCLRKLSRFHEALEIQLQLLQEYNAMEQDGTINMPVEMFTLFRAWVQEELAEIYTALEQKETASSYAQVAYDALSHNEMFQMTSPERLQRLHEISELSY